MINKVKLTKKILISVIVLSILLWSVFIFYINQSKFVELNSKQLAGYLPGFVRDVIDPLYAGKVVDYNSQIPACTVNSDRTIILRLDDVKAWQYYDTVVNITSLILSRNMAITLAVIPKDIEKDTKLFLPWIINIKKDPRVEIALHGYLHQLSEFKNLSREDADYRLEKGKELLYKYMGIVPVTFVPPENEYSDASVDALSDNGFRVLAAGQNDQILGMRQYFEIGENLSYIGYTARTYDFSNTRFISAEEVLKECSTSLDKDGLCVITIHPQDYLTPDRKQIDEARYAEFIGLLDGLKSLDAEFKTFKDVANCTSA